MGENLRGRLAQRANGQQQPRAEVAERDKPLVDLVREMQPQFQLAMPRGAEATQLVRDVLTMISQTPKLKECVPLTVLGGAMTMAQLGLRPGVLGHGWLLPFWDSKARVHKAQLVIGYQGLVELVHRSDRIVSIAARTVYTNDEFRLGYGAEADTFVHNPQLDGPRGDPRLYYAIARMKGGGYALTDPMTHADMEAYRDRYAMAKTKEGVVVGPWRDQFEGMAHKTMIRKLVKLLPKSTELAQALEADEAVRIDLSPTGIERTEHVVEGVVEGDSFEPDTGQGGEADAKQGGEVDVGHADPDGDPPAVGELITRPQLTALNAGLSALGYTTRDARMAFLSQELRRDVGSSFELTKAEASTLIDKIQRQEAAPAGRDESQVDADGFPEPPADWEPEPVQ